MNRRRILSSVHRSLARKASTAVAPIDHAPVERLSIADLDRLGPRLAPTPKADSGRPELAKADA
jgi:hypothetical protein